MRYFKHYANAGTSESLAKLEEKLGFAGVGRYWRMLEFLAENFDSENCTFRIHRRNIREMLRLRSWNDCETFMECFGNVRGMSVKYSENVFEINAPILLELQSRDFKKARKDRAETAPKIKSKNKIKNKDKEIEKKPTQTENFDEVFFEKAKSAWKEATGTGTMGNAEKKIKNLINTDEKKNELLLAIENYGRVLAIETDRPMKTSLDTFIGSLERKLYYRDYIDQDCIKDAMKRASRKNSVASKEQANEDFMLEMLRKSEAGLL